jgi:hypothetical protein
MVKDSCWKAFARNVSRVVEEQSVVDIRVIRHSSCGVQSGRKSEYDFRVVKHSVVVFRVVESCKKGDSNDSLNKKNSF